jgi:1-deoxy-D-xylulose-5-phosphate reductoisomerase
MILGSTGSIGCQALEVISANADCFSVYGLTAHVQWELLVEQARRFSPEVVVIVDERYYVSVRDALSDLPIKVWSGVDSLDAVVSMPDIDMVLSALVGFAGLSPTLSAIRAGKAVALANKETLVVAGELVMRLAKENDVPILPVDSEHSAIFQCLSGEGSNVIEKLILTASGGPFRSYSLSELAHVTASEALRHPNWVMGSKVTIDSSTLMNKGFEVIEASWLFGMGLDRIEVLIHPESIIHSMVQFTDGSIKAQLGMPDMRLPISYALSYPVRLPNVYPRIDWSRYGSLTFELPDLTRFRNLGLAYDALRRGGSACCVLNAANEVVVSSFLSGGIKFLEMSEVIEEVLGVVEFIKSPSYGDYVMTDGASRERALEIIGKKTKK